MAIEQWEPDACMVKEAFSGSGLETQLIALGKFSFQVGMENTARLIGKGIFISWRIAGKKKKFPYLTSFPQFHIPAFSEMLVLVKFMHAHNFLGQELIQIIINLSEDQSVSPLIHLIRQPLKSRISTRKVAGMRSPPFGISPHLCQFRVITDL